MGSIDWPGATAGLKVMDRIIAVDGQTFHNGREIVAYATEKPLSTSIQYTIESAGRFSIVTVPTAKFRLRDFFIVFLVPFVGGSIIFCLGCIVYVLKPNEYSSWIFFSFCLFLGIYIITSIEMQSTYVFAQLNYFCIPLVPATLFHLCLTFPDRKRILDRYSVLEYIVYLPAFMLIAGYMAYLFSFSFGKPTTWIPDIGNVTRINRFFYLVCLLGLIGLLIHSWNRAKSHAARQRAKMIIFGVTSAFLPSVLIMLALVLLQITFPMNFLVFFVVLFPASIAYAIIRHNLFDADTIIRRAVGYAVVTIVIMVAYLGVSITFNVFLGQYQLAQSRGFPVIFTLAILLVFNPLRNRIQAVIDKLFFRKDYDYQETVQMISDTMRSLLKPDQICRKIMKFAIEPMFVDSGSVMILSKDKNEYQCFIQSGEREDQGKETEYKVKANLSDEKVVFDDEVEKGGESETESHVAAVEISKLKLSANNPLLQKITEQKKEVTIYDIREDPFFKDDRKAYEKAFDLLGATLIVPLLYEDRLIGIIALGNKKSGKFYRREDINMLNTLASQGALAVENARMVEEIVEKERLRAKILDTFGKYVTAEVRDQILEGNITMDGEAKDVTLLFADLRDFTTLAESTTPKEVVKIINGYFSEMADAIGKNNGLVLQFIGDEIEAVFGAPLPLEDHPTHAVRAALAMQERLVLVNEQLAHQGYRPLRHGIGIHTGTVVAANIGSEDRLSYAMVGDTVNLASRIQGLNKEFGTDLLISATTVERMADNIEVEKLSATTVKGKRDPVNIYKLI
jgi:class 3 adenylate cyclase